MKIIIAGHTDIINFGGFDCKDALDCPDSPGCDAYDPNTGTCYKDQLKDRNPKGLDVNALPLFDYQAA